MNLVFGRRAIEAFPPRQVRLAAKAAAHRFDHVTRVSKQVDLTWFAQGLEANGGSDDLCLLIRRAS
jgi:hypothetical protein